MGFALRTSMWINSFIQERQVAGEGSKFLNPWWGDADFLDPWFLIVLGVQIRKFLRIRIAGTSSVSECKMRP